MAIAGPTDVQGPKGDKGDPGDPGAPGAPGADGKTVLNGAGAPSNSLGVNGDFYIDTTADAIYGPKAAGVWGSPTSLIGPAGSAGQGLAAGGTTGQHLVKKSNTDYDTEWVDDTGGSGSGLDLVSYSYFGGF